VPKSKATALSLSLALAALLALLIAGCGGGSSSSPTSSGSASSTAGTTTDSKADSTPDLMLEPGLSDWPFFGRTPQRTHYLATRQGSVDRPLDPPLRQAWTVNTHGLIEFPPAIADGVAYTINKYGNGKAIELDTRKIIGELNLDPKNKGHQVDVTGPVFYRGLLYGAFLDGVMAAGDAKTGKVAWVRHLHTHLESSPLPVDGNLYLGTDSHQLLALDAADGHTVWTFSAPGAVKASPSYDAGNVFVGDYESTMFALDAKTGKVAWRTNTSEVAPGGKGGFFSSPAIAFGTSTRPATTAPSMPSTRRPARSAGPSRPAARSTARPPSPRSRARRQPSTSALKTASSTPSTRAPARSAGPTASAARCRGRRP
jgi:hypothetical protein